MSARSLFISDLRFFLLELLYYPATTSVKNLIKIYMYLCKTIDCVKVQWFYMSLMQRENPQRPWTFYFACVL